ncbi:Conserved hypothetical protein [Synechococcus sp. RCC307]|nr:Conserved hypothetical protein [Synechococcus sp. RCC307]
MTATLFLCCPSLSFSGSTARTANSFNRLKNLLSVFDISVKTLFLSSDQNDLASAEAHSYFDYIFFSPCEGVYAAFNAAIKKSLSLSADWIWLLGEGDTILCERLDLSILSQNLSLGSHILMMNMFVGDRKLRCKLKEAFPSPLFSLDTMRFNHPASIISANAYSINGLYSLDYKVVSDYYWLHKACAANLSITHLPFVSVYHELGGISTSSGKSRFFEHYQCLLALNRVYGFSFSVFFALIFRLTRCLVSSFFAK